MTSQGNICRLCGEICEDYKRLYDETGNANEVQQLMSQYFDENLLHMVSGNNYTVMCMECWHTISDFNTFQQSIYRTQRILRMTVEEIDIKMEEEFLPEDHIASSNCEQATDWDNLAGEIATLPMCDISNTHDYISNADDIVGGEFANETNSSKLLVKTELIAEPKEVSKIKDSLTKSIPEKLRLEKKFSISIKDSNDIIAQWMPVLECLLCTETYSTYSLLQRHFHDKHSPLKCQVKCCSIYFYRRDKFADHIRLHIDSNAFACTFCGTNKTCRISLVKHIRKHHPASIDATKNPKKHSGTVTPKVTEIPRKSIPKNIVEWKSCRTKHIKGSNDAISQMKPALKCNFCPEKYITYSLFRQHFAENHPEEKFYIKCCELKLTSRCHILEHLQLHANPDVFKCNLCEVRCRNRLILQRHMRRRHTTSIKQKSKPEKINEKSDDLLSKWLPSRKCAVCTEAFATLNELELHFLECHPSEAFYVECCQQKFMTRRKIVEHVRYHVKASKFKCDICCLCYSNNMNLKRHIGKVH